MSDDAKDDGLGLANLVEIAATVALTDDDDGDYDLQPDDEPADDWKFYLWMALIVCVLGLIFRC